MKYEFSSYGHPNLLSTHKTTLEFTKDSELTKRGDCIVGVNADFELKELKKFTNCSKVRITITSGGITEIVTAIPNKDFSSNHEIVIRKSEFYSERTFAIRADKAASDLNRDLIRLMVNAKASILIEEI